MSDKRLKTLTIIIEDDTGTVQTHIRSELSAPQLMDKIFELKVDNEQLRNFIDLMNMRQKWKLYNYIMDNDSEKNCKVEVGENVKRFELDVRIDLPKFLIDNATNKRYHLLLINDIEEIVDLLNELSDENNILNKNEDDLKECTIENIKLKEENEKLRQMIKENVFQQYSEGSLADLEFKAIAYDDIIKVKLSDESEPKVMVYCNYGKRKNVMSFCQMFIPFGIVYEIKEVIDDE